MDRKIKIKLVQADYKRSELAINDLIKLNGESFILNYTLDNIKEVQQNLSENKLDEANLFARGASRIAFCH